MFGGAFDLGKNRENIDKIITAVSDVLSTIPPEKETLLDSDHLKSSVADELLKLQQRKNSWSFNSRRI